MRVTDSRCKIEFFFHLPPPKPSRYVLAPVRATFLSLSHYSYLFTLFLFFFFLSNSQFFLLLDPSKTTARAIHLIFDIVKYDVFDRFFLS